MQEYTTCTLHFVLKVFIYLELDSYDIIDSLYVLPKFSVNIRIFTFIPCFIELHNIMSFFDWCRIMFDLLVDFISLSVDFVDFDCLPFTQIKPQRKLKIKLALAGFELHTLTVSVDHSTDLTIRSCCNCFDCSACE